MNPYNSIIYYDDFSYERNPEMQKFVNSPEMQTLLAQINEKCILVLGGDGTMLRFIGEHFEKNIPFLGLNFGHKGFLLNDSSWLDSKNPDFEKRDYPLLDIKLNEQKIGTVFNDMHIYSPQGKAISLKVQNGFGDLDLWGDGMVLATPAGSTGHSKSYGGPILPHKSENLVITPKGNISPQSPKALDDENPILIKNTGRQYPVAVNIDGDQVFVSQMDESFSLQVQKSKQSVQLLIAKNHLRDWDNKVLQEQGFTT